MYSVNVRDHIMIAHSLPDNRFGPAQHMHGATYVVDATFRSEKLNALNIVIDIAEATKMLQTILSRLNYRNLDDMTEFKDVLTTTEYLAWFIHNEMSKQLPENISLKITLHESHVASASYEDPDGH